MKPLLQCIPRAAIEEGATYRVRRQSSGRLLYSGPRLLPFIGPRRWVQQKRRVRNIRAHLPCFSRRLSCTRRHSGLPAAWCCASAAKVAGASSLRTWQSGPEQPAGSVEAERSAPVTPAPRVIQPFGVNPTFQFATGHTSQPMSLELIQIGDTNKKHHTIPDNVLLTYLGSKRRSLSLDDLDDWATAAIDEEVARLQLAKQKWDAFRAFDDALYGVNPAASSQFPATCLDTFLTAYPQKHLAAISQFETAQKLIKAYNSRSILTRRRLSETSSDGEKGPRLNCSSESRRSIQASGPL